MATKRHGASPRVAVDRRPPKNGEHGRTAPHPPIGDSDAASTSASQTPVFPDPSCVSKFLLPVRFRELWAEGDIETALASDALPSELWEAVCAVLWRRAKEQDRGAEKLRSAIVQALRTSSRKRDLPPILRALAAADVPQGRERGRAITDIELVFIHPLVMEILAAYHSRGKGYSRDSITRLEANLEDAWDRSWEMLRQDAPFPREDLSAAIRERRSPRAIADLFLGRACRTTPDTIATYLKEARQGFRRLKNSPDETLRSIPAKLGFDFTTNKLGRGSWLWKRNRAIPQHLVEKIRARVAAARAPGASPPSVDREL